MYIPTSSDLCPAKLFKRDDFGDRVVSTAQAFRSWDTCMDNRVCKIIAIVGITLGGLVALWILSSIMNCIFCGFTSVCRAMTCGCCGAPRQKQGPAYRNREDPFANPHMYPPQGRASMYQYQPPAQMSPSYGGYNPKGAEHVVVRDYDDTESYRSPNRLQNPFAENQNSRASRPYY